MNYSIYRFTLDIHKTKSQVSIPVLFHDTGIQFFITLTDGGRPYFIEDGCRAVFSAKKSDGKPLLNDCIIEDNTRVRYDFTEQTTNCEGMMNCEIRLYGKDGELITTPAFVVVVDARVIYDNDVKESYGESTTLDNIVAYEESRLAGERMRIAAEDERAAAEEARAEAEAERVLAEADRRDAEIVRNNTEIERSVEEAVRQANEAERVAAFAHMLGSWVAYSAHEDGTDYTWTWSEGQRYIGICNGKYMPQDKTGFVWSKFVDTGVYVGSGDMPSWCDLQIDPEGDVTEIKQTTGQSDIDVMSQKAVSETFANAIKGTASGAAVAIADASPIEHEIAIKVSGVEDVSTVKVLDCGKNILDVATAPLAGHWHNNNTKNWNFERTETGLKYNIINDTNVSWCQERYQICPVDMVRGKTITVSLKRTGKEADTATYMLVQTGDDDFTGEHTYKASGFINTKNYTGNSALKPVNGYLKHSFTISKDDMRKNLFLILYVGSEMDCVAGDVIEYSDIQVEINDTATEYEPYIEPTEHTVDATGAVKGIIGNGKAITLYTDTAGAVLDCTYNKDANKAVNDLFTRIAALEAAVLK